jgi:hypothetical protein
LVACGAVAQYNPSERKCAPAIPDTIWML